MSILNLFEGTKGIQGSKGARGESASKGSKGDKVTYTRTYLKMSVGYFRFGNFQKIKTSGNRKFKKKKKFKYFLHKQRVL